jgi:hypothetical protein
LHFCLGQPQNINLLPSLPSWDYSLLWLTLNLFYNVLAANFWNLPQKVKEATCYHCPLITMSLDTGKLGGLGLNSGSYHFQSRAGHYFSVLQFHQWEIKCNKTTKFQKSENKITYHNSRY